MIQFKEPQVTKSELPVIMNLAWSESKAFLLVEFYKTVHLLELTWRIENLWWSVLHADFMGQHCMAGFSMGMPPVEVPVQVVHIHLLLLSTIHSFTSTTTSSTSATSSTGTTLPVCVCVCVCACARGMHIMGGDHKRATCTRISLYMIIAIAIHGIHDDIHDAIHNLYIMLLMTLYIPLYMTLCMPKKLCMISGL